MDNSINNMQNDAFLLRCLVAQREAYRKAKYANSWKFWLTVMFAIISVIALFVNKEIIFALSGLYALGLVVFSQHIDAFISKTQFYAASVQQYFDVSLYSFMLVNKVDDWGTLPTKTDLAEIVSKVEPSLLASVRNWYNNYSTFSPIEQVFFCQKENLRWDNKLRSEFRQLILWAFWITTIIFTVIAIIVNPSLVKCILVLTWLLPIANFCLFYYRNLKRDIDRLCELKKKSDSIEAMLNREVSMPQYELIKLQNQIYKNREQAVLIPDWFYYLRQAKHQAEEDQAADAIRNVPQVSSGESTSVNLNLDT